VGGGPVSVRDLTTAPVGHLMRRLAIPASVGFFLNTMYNVVDTFWAGRFHTDALAALSLSFPVFFILIAMGSGFSTGATALMGHALGEDDRRGAARYAAQGVVSAILAAAVIMVVGYAASPSLFRLLGADGEYLSICLEYLNVVLLGTPAVMLFYMFNGVLNAQGDTHSFRDYMLIATVVNVGLDPWFMYGGWGVPAMGVGGIALATVMMQAGGAAFLAWKSWRTGLLWRSEGARWRPHWPTLRAITVQAVPSSLNLMTVAVGFFIMTWFLSGFGKVAVAAYGAATRIEQIVLLPALGLNVATLTLAARNAGARRYGRVRQTVRAALSYGAVVMAAGAVLLYFGARPLMALFTDDPAVIAVGAPYLRIAAFIEFAYVVIMVNAAALQGLKRPAAALWIGLLRQVLAPVVVYWLATRVWGLGLMGIWWSLFGIAWVSAAVAVVVARRQAARLEASGPTPPAADVVS
jgi:putative MATE family efflux protein